MGEFIVSIRWRLGKALLPLGHLIGIKAQKWGEGADLIEGLATPVAESNLSRFYDPSLFPEAGPASLDRPASTATPSSTTGAGSSIRSCRRRTSTTAKEVTWIQKDDCARPELRVTEVTPGTGSAAKATLELLAGRNRSPLDPHERLPLAQGRHRRPRELRRDPGNGENTTIAARGARAGQARVLRGGTRSRGPRGGARAPHDVGRGAPVRLARRRRLPGDGRSLPRRRGPRARHAEPAERLRRRSRRGRTPRAPGDPGDGLQHALALAALPEPGRPLPRRRAPRTPATTATGPCSRARSTRASRRKKSSIASSPRRTRAACASSSTWCRTTCTSSTRTCPRRARAGSSTTRTAAPAARPRAAGRRTSRRAGSRRTSPRSTGETRTWRGRRRTISRGGSIAGTATACASTRSP